MPRRPLLVRPDSDSDLDLDLSRRINGYYDRDTQEVRFTRGSVRPNIPAGIEAGTLSPDDIELHNGILGQGSCGVVLNGVIKITGVPVAIKHSKWKIGRGVNRFCRTSICWPEMQLSVQTWCNAMAALVLATLPSMR